MLNLRIKIPNVPLFNSELAKKVIREEATLFFMKTLSAIQSQAIRNAPVGDTGLLRASIRQRMSFEPVLKGEVWVDVLYGYPVEFGRRPGRMPPVSAFINWIRRSKKGRAFFQALKEKYPKISVWSAAFVIARKIKFKGTKGQYFLSRAVEKLGPRIKSWIIEFMKKVGERLAKG